MTPIKMNPKQSKFLNTRHKTIKPVEENTIGNHHTIDLGDGFLDMTQRIEVIIKQAQQVVFICTHVICICIQRIHVMLHICNNNN